jgi:hypothetical protein
MRALDGFLTNIGAIVVLALFLALPQHASAKPKKPSFGCGIQQIQSAQAAPCIAKADDDILKGRAYTHVVYCSSTGKMLCCRVDNATQQIIDQSCSLSMMRPGIGKRLFGTGTLQQKKQPQE